MKKKTKKRMIMAIVSVLLSIVIIAVSYLLYVVLSYSRIEDKLLLEIKGNATKTVPIGEELSLVTYNIGFGAYSPDYSFFMDGGEYSRAFSRDAVVSNTNGALAAVKRENPDFVLFQEVDTDGTRSYHVNQSKILKKGFSNCDSTFAQNYDSAYLFYPFKQPIGANRSGIFTFSRFDISKSTRISLPVEDSFYKFLDLDRAYSVSEIKTESGNLLVLYNVHLSAYTSDGTIADTQLKMLVTDMKSQYDKGNYVVAAGDFNKDMLGDSSKYFKRNEGDFTWAKPLNESLLPKEITAYSGKNSPSCRNADSPYRGDGTDFVLSVDGVLISDNIELVSCETLDLDFAYSDHDPVKAKLILK